MVSMLTVTPPGGPGELHSLEGALRRWRDLRTRGEAARDFVIELGGGVYEQSAPLYFTELDAWPLTVRAAPGEQPILDGGARLTNWRVAEHQGKIVWIAPVPARALAMGPVRQLFVNGERRTRSIWPKYPDVLTPAGTTRPVTGRLFTACDSFIPAPADWSNDWNDPAGIEAVLLQKWTDCRLPVERFEPESGAVLFSLNTRFEIDPAHTRYFWENVREKMTEPGEYYFDRQAGEIWYLPKPGETPDSIEAFVPATGALVVFRGKPGNPVRFIRFEGIAFRHAGAPRPEVRTAYDFHNPVAEDPRNEFILSRWVRSNHASGRFGGSPQAAAHLPGIISLFYAADLAICGCRFTNSGWYGVLVGGGCDSIRIENNDFLNLGGGGITASGGADSVLKEEPMLCTRRLIITDNHIAECGRDSRCSVGILLGHVSDSVIEHNHIHDLYYSGISCGWSWGFAPNSAHDVKIGYNHIHDLGHGMLCDMGGVYLLGIQPGTRVYNNHIHDINCRFYGGWGVYTDEGSSHIVVEENICHDCSRDGLHQHYGRENIFRYNLCAFNGESGLRISCGLTDRDDKNLLPGEHYRKNINFFGNVLVQSGNTFFLTQARETLGTEEFYSDGNFFYDPAPDAALPFAKNIPEWFEFSHPAWSATFAEWRALGHDMGSVWGDPMFVSLEKRDFHLRDDSPLRGRFPDTARTLDCAGIRQPSARSKP